MSAKYHRSEHPSLTVLINEILIGHCPEPLLSLDTHRQLRRITDFIPAHKVWHFGYELSMSSVDANADFGVCVRHEDIPVLDSLIRQLPKSPSELVARSKRLFASSAIRKSEFVVPHCWLEFDFRHAPRISLLPSMLFEIAPTDTDTLLEYATEFIRTWYEKSRATRENASLRKIIGKLPPQSRVFEFGIMASRDKQPFRVAVRNVPIRALIDLLKDIDFPQQPTERLALLNREWKPNILEADVAFDLIAGEFSPRFGIEFKLGKTLLKNSDSQIVEYSCPAHNQLKQQCLGNFAAHLESTLTGSEYELSVYHMKFAITESTVHPKVYLSVLRRI